MNNIPEEKDMRKKTLNLFLNATGVGLGLAGLILILISIFTEKDTLKWGMLCIALGSILAFIRILLKPKEP
jgi:hypothetical protein